VDVLDPGGVVEDGPVGLEIAGEERGLRTSGKALRDAGGLSGGSALGSGEA
jgi:hypothetical protein